MRQEKKLFFKLFALFFTFFITACSVDRIDYTDTSHLNTVGVVSLLGDRFHSIHFGNTPIQNESYTTDVSQWQVDDFVNKVGTNILNKKYNIKSVNMYQDSRLLFNMYHKDEVAFYEAYDYLKRVKGKIIEMAKGYNLDAVLLVLPRFSKEKAEFKKGYGIVSKDYFRHKGQQLYTMATIYLLDVESEEIIGWAETDPKEFMANENIGKWRDSFDRYSQKEKREIEKALKERIYKDLLLAFTSETLRLNSIKRRMANFGY